MFELQKAVPIPTAIRHSTPRRRKYPFEGMEIGDMFFVEGKTKNNLYAHVSLVSKQLGRKFATRLTHMRKVKGKWELCEPDDRGATQGVGVWRLE